MNQLHVRENTSIPASLRSKKPFQKYKPDVDQLEEVVIDEKFKLSDLEDGSYFIPVHSMIEARDEKKGGLLLLMNAESGGFINVIVSYRYVRQFRKLLQHYDPLKIFVNVVEDQFTATSGYNAGNSLAYNKLEFNACKSDALNKLRSTLPNREFVDKLDEDTAGEIVEKVYNNEDKKAEEHFLVWSAKLDEKEQLIEDKKRQVKKRAARGYCPKKAAS